MFIYIPHFPHPIWIRSFPPINKILLIFSASQYQSIQLLAEACNEKVGQLKLDYPIQYTELIWQERSGYC